MFNAESLFDYFIFNGTITPTSVPYNIDEGSPFLYEVIRLMEGIPLYIEEHLERLNNSLKLTEINETINASEILKSLFALIQKYHIRNNNVKIALWLYRGVSQWGIWFIPSIYPEESLYLEGVKTDFLQIERPNPNAKRLHHHIKTVTTELCHAQNLYEVILVTQKNIITEGSRSNLFFTQNQKIVTSPNHRVLEGITRLKLIELLNREGIPILYKDIHIEDITCFDGAFLTGTSIHILPISTMGRHTFASAHHPLIHKLMSLMALEIKKNIETNQKEALHRGKS